MTANTASSSGSLRPYFRITYATPMIVAALATVESKTSKMNVRHVPDEIIEVNTSHDS